MAVCASTPSSFRLNPDAPFFVPVAFSAVEDFSAEWWHLVQNSPAFREYWLAERFDPEMQLACDLDTLDLLDLDSEFPEEEEHLPAANMDLKEFAQLAGLKAESAVSKPGRRPFSPLPYLDKPLKVSQPPKPGMRKIQQPREVQVWIFNLAQSLPAYLLVLFVVVKFNFGLLI
ncbi:hypothetical protein L7F22_022703 [Adiantum nelumboides]|nr:hypothetical protein [Adiantum nelumboides]